MPFRATFDCLWCGASHATRGRDDLEGWAQLCPSCIGKAGDNGFLRFRLHQALRERASAGGLVNPPAGSAGGLVDPPATSASGHTSPSAGTSAPEVSDDAGIAGRPTHSEDLIAYYEARAPEYDDWYLRRGRFARGAIHDAAWAAELDAAGRWLDGLPWHGELVELAAGTGWWSPLLATKGELSLYDATGVPLDRARERLMAHGLRAHLHVRDAWAEPDRTVDGLFTGFWLSHVDRDRLAAFLSIARSWLRPGGRFAAVDSLSGPASSASDHPTPRGDRAVRRLDDGREFSIVKVYYTPEELLAGLESAGFVDVEVTTTGRFFVLVTATAPVAPE